MVPIPRAVNPAANALRKRPSQWRPHCNMLKYFPSSGGDGEASPEEMAEAIWLDMENPTEAETKQVEQALGTALPSQSALSEIETSSRLRIRDGVLTMSTPSAAHHSSETMAVAPVGFVLSAEKLVTVRFGPGPAFDAIAAKFGEAGEANPTCSLDTFIQINEEIVDRIADGLEHLAEKMGQLSMATFHADETNGKGAIRANRLLRIQLRQVGRLGDRLSEVRDGLLGLGRIVTYTDHNAGDWADGAFKARLASLKADIASLGDYEEHLANKVQFILDAMVGLIGIAQNDIFKILTIVSIVGIPPTLMAGVYGMNFKTMPEYNWPWGYAWGWGVIIVSALVPLVWFKIKDWF